MKLVFVLAVISVNQQYGNTSQITNQAIVGRQGHVDEIQRDTNRHSMKISEVPSEQKDTVKKQEGAIAEAEMRQRDAATGIDGDKKKLMDTASKQDTGLDEGPSEQMNTASVQEIRNDDVPMTTAIAIDDVHGNRASRQGTRVDEVSRDIVADTVMRFGDAKGEKV